jgi:hypothetical protein
MIWCLYMCVLECAAAAADAAGSGAVHVLRAAPLLMERCTHTADLHHILAAAHSMQFDASGTIQECIRSWS